MLEKLTRRAGAESIKERERSELVLKSWGAGMEQIKI